jgi:predicted house-cleaning noncanonical NTP pyrophosphatase (MazG superfamily)
MEKYYDKLVRDNIPDIIEKQGNIPIVRKLSAEEYIKYLNKKLKEETEEYLAENNIEELCDILEVIDALAHALNYSDAQLEQMRQIKEQKNGRFKDRTLLEKVIINNQKL